jgi:leader peptidase (prepilin peptidase) / N-methyltransferase
MLEAILAAFAGLLIGSFLNVCIFRLPRDLSVVRPRSFCPACEKMIAWYDNVPLLSFVLLRGRCRHCGTRIAFRYPLVEILTALLFAVYVALLGLTLPALKHCIFTAILITLIFSDLEERILPDEFTLGGTLVGIVLAFFVLMPTQLSLLFLPFSIKPLWRSVSEAAIGAGVSSGTIWFVGWAFEKIRHREGLGFGDVKMIAMIGAFLGLEKALLTLIVASLFGAISGAIYILFARKDASTYELPFGSFLGMAALGVDMFGEVAVRWYSQLGR